MNNDNYAEKRELFNKLWKVKLHQYTNAEMNEIQIQAAYERHQEEFNSDWRWISHTQSIDGMLFDDGESQPVLDSFMAKWEQNPDIICYEEERSAVSAKYKNLRRMLEHPDITEFIISGN